MKYFDNFTKMPKNGGDLSKIIVATGFENLPNLVTLVTSKNKDQVEIKKIYRFKESP